MKSFPRWKYGLLFVVLTLGLVYAAPNVFVEDPAVQISANKGAAIDTSLIGSVQGFLQAASITPRAYEEENDTSLLIRFKNAEDQLRGKDVIRAGLSEQYTVALNLASSTPAWLRAVGADPMKLGLDLRGGVHFLLAIDMDSFNQRRTKGNVRGIGSQLRSEKIRYRDLQLHPAGDITLDFRTKEDMNKATRMIENSYRGEFVVSKTNLPDGIFRLSLDISPNEKLKTQDYAVDQTMTILRNRINELGVAEPIVQRQGASRIAVDLPGIQDTARAKQILGGTATVEMHLVDTEHDLKGALEGQVPVGSTLYDYEGHPVLLQNRVILSGTSITGASSSIGENGRPSVNIRLGGGDESLFYRVTRQNIGRPMAIVYVETKMTGRLDNGDVVYTPHKTEKVISVATIKSALGNNFQITGLSDPQESRNLSLLLRSGALPAPISIIEESTVGPSMGKENINKGVFSVVIGFLLIVFFMGIYYRFFGLVANLALGMNLVLLVALLSILGATLTLPGIAGIVLTVGMAVDANVLIFERIREELRNGMSPQASIQAGYEKAFSTIVDSNVTTLIAAVALFALGTGAIKGFAVTVTLGLLTSMFTAITGTRAVVAWFYGKRRVEQLSIGIKV